MFASTNPIETILLWILVAFSPEFGRILSGEVNCPQNNVQPSHGIYGMEKGLLFNKEDDE